MEWFHTEFGYLFIQFALTGILCRNDNSFKVFPIGGLFVNQIAEKGSEAKLGLNTYRANPIDH